MSEIPKGKGYFNLECALCGKDIDLKEETKFLHCKLCSDGLGDYHIKCA